MTVDPVPRDPTSGFHTCTHVCTYTHTNSNFHVDTWTNKSFFKKSFIEKWVMSSIFLRKFCDLTITFSQICYSHASLRREFFVIYLVLYVFLEFFLVCHFMLALSEHFVYHVSVPGTPVSQSLQSYFRTRANSGADTAWIRPGQVLSNNWEVLRKGSVPKVKRTLVLRSLRLLKRTLCVHQERESQTGRPSQLQPQLPGSPRVMFTAAKTKGYRSSQGISPVIKKYAVWFL